MRRFTHCECVHPHNCCGLLAQFVLALQSARWFQSFEQTQNIKLHFSSLTHPLCGSTTQRSTFCSGLAHTPTKMNNTGTRHRWAKSHDTASHLKRKSMDGGSASGTCGRRCACNTSSSYEDSPTHDFDCTSALPLLKISYSGYSNPAAAFGCEWVRPVCLSPGPAPPLLLQLSSVPATGVYGYNLGPGCAVQVLVKQGQTLILDTVAALSEAGQLR